MTDYIYVKTVGGEHYLKAECSVYFVLNKDNFHSLGNKLWLITFHGEDNDPRFYPMSRFKHFTIPHHQIEHVGELEPDSDLVQEFRRVMEQRNKYGVET